MDPVPKSEGKKCFFNPGMSTDEVMKTYGLSSDQAYKAKKKGFFVKNYSKKQIIIDRENFNSEVVYPLAKKVFGKNFKRNPLAQSLYDDMIQEAVTRLFELSGKVKEMANGKYSENYAASGCSQRHACFPENLGTSEQVVRRRLRNWPIRSGKGRGCIRRILGGCMFEDGEREKRSPYRGTSSCRFCMEMCHSMDGTIYQSGPVSGVAG